MALLPQILEEDVREINHALRDFLVKSAAKAALLTAEGGFLICHEGQTDEIDITTLSALAANSFTATQAIAELISEPNFRTVYQQGEKLSLFMSDIGKSTTLIVLFPSSLSVGAVKYYAAPLVPFISEQLRKAKLRTPGNQIDMAMMNVSDISTLFKGKG